MRKLFEIIEQRALWKTLSVLLSILAFLRLGILNGYPFVYPDTGTYIYSGFAGFVPVDRPIFYGLFLRHISLAWSLWLPIIVQASIAAYLILLAFKHIARSTQPYTLTAFSCILLSFISTVSLHLCLLIPDVFTSFLFLALAILLFADSLSRIKRLSLFAIIILSCMVHYSNLLSFTIISVGLLVNVLLRKTSFIQKRVSILLAGVALLLWIGIPAINSLYGFGFHYSKSTHVMTLAKMIERGILPDYLREHCRTEQLHLCNKPIPSDPNDFIYRTDISPLYDSLCLQTAWTECWIQREEECNKIIKDILTDPKYRTQLVKTEITLFFDQLTRTGVGIFYPKQHEEHISEWIYLHYKREDAQYKVSGQYNSSFSFPFLLKVHRIMLMSCALLLIFWTAFNLRKKERLTYFVLYILLFILLNALVCSTFIMVDARYMDRAAWLITFSAALLLLNRVFERHRYTVE